MTDGQAASSTGIAYCAAMESLARQLKLETARVHSLRACITILIKSNQTCIYIKNT